MRLMRLLWLMAEIGSHNDLLLQWQSRSLNGVDGVDGVDDSDDDAGRLFGFAGVSRDEGEERNSSRLKLVSGMLPTGPPGAGRRRGLSQHRWRRRHGGRCWCWGALVAVGGGGARCEVSEFVLWR